MLQIMPDLLRWDLILPTPHVDLLISVHTGDDEENPRAPGSSSQQPAQPEDDGPLVLLDHLHHEHQGEGEGDEDEEE